MEEQNAKVEDQRSCCAHSTVKRFQVGNECKIFEEQWHCADCGTKFYHIPEMFSTGEIQMLEPHATLRDQFAMAALNAYISCDDSGCTFWPTGDKGEEICKESYEWADRMIKTRDRTDG